MCTFATMKHRIYVASSWRNEFYPEVVQLLREAGHEVYDFHNDIEAMEACDTCVLVLPCGRSAHTEAGWFAGKGRTTIAYIPERQEPELMYKLFSAVCCSMDELINVLLLFYDYETIIFSNIHCHFCWSCRS